MINYDVLLEDLGSFGISQILIVLMLCYYNIAGGMNSLATVFIQHSPDTFRFDNYLFVTQILPSIR